MHWQMRVYILGILILEMLLLPLLLFLTYIRSGWSIFSRVWLPKLAQEGTGESFSKVIPFPEWCLGDDDPCDHSRPTDAATFRLLDGVVQAI
jgi:hypothetical protein